MNLHKALIANEIFDDGGSGGGGSSDFSTATVTIIVNAGSGAGGLLGGIQGINAGCGFIKTYEGYHMIVTNAGVSAGQSLEATAILMKTPNEDFEAVYEIVGLNPVVTGSAELVTDNEELKVNGDCTITVDPTT